MSKQTLVKFLGYWVLILSLFFVLNKVWLSKDVFTKWQPGLTDCLTLTLLAAGYALVSVLLSIAWFNLLKYYGYTMIGFYDCFCIYTKTQIAKYIPGNIFQLTARHMASREMSVKDGSLIAAAFSEIIGLIIASVFITLAGLLMWETHSGFISVRKVLMVLAVALGMLLIIRKIFQINRVRNIFFLHGQSDSPSALVFVFCFYLFFFVLTGGLFISLIHMLIIPMNYENILPVMLVFSISWLAGFITPGAPGGMGVREAVMISILSHYIAEPESVMAALLFRIVTISGDFILFLFSFLKFFIHRDAGMVGKRK